MVERYKAKGAVVTARLYKASETDTLARDIAQFTADPTLLVQEHDRTIRVAGFTFPLTVLVVYRRLKVRDA